MDDALNSVDESRKAAHARILDLRTRVLPSKEMTELSPEEQEEAIAEMLRAQREPGSHEFG
ncbi:MAG: hypothetical protein ACREH4_00195 [Vitreimonas sp.]